MLDRIWKERKQLDGTQNSINMDTASSTELRKWHNHCQQMIFRPSDSRMKLIKEFQTIINYLKGVEYFYKEVGEDWNYIGIKWWCDSLKEDVEGIPLSILRDIASGFASETHLKITQVKIARSLIFRQTVNFTSKERAMITEKTRAKTALIGALELLRKSEKEKIRPLTICNKEGYSFEQYKELLNMFETKPIDMLLLNSFQRKELITRLIPYLISVEQLRIKTWSNRATTIEIVLKERNETI